MTPRCAGQDCPIRNNCARHVKPSTGWIDQYRVVQCVAFISLAEAAEARALPIP